MNLTCFTNILSGSWTKVLKENGSINQLFSGFFQDGERFDLAPAVSHDGDILILYNILNADDFLSLCSYLDYLKDATSHKIYLIIPYFAYAAMDRPGKNKELPKGQTCFKALASFLSEVQNIDVYFIDLHEPKLMSLLPPELEVSNFTTCDLIEYLGFKADIISTTDYGKHSELQLFLKEKEKKGVLIGKKRSKTGQVNSKLIREASGTGDVLIIDDMVRSGATFIKAYELLKDEYHEVSGFITHSVVCSPEMLRFLNESSLNKLFLGNSHPNYKKFSSVDKVETVDVLSCVIKKIFL